MNPRPLTIVGGGLAGLTLGIGLRQRGVPVTILEAGRYPRHRVCGEFISGRGQRTLERLGLTSRLVEAGAVPARTAVFFSRRAQSPVWELAEPALSISRQALDATLAREFGRLGGDLQTGERWRGNDCPEGTVRASGRRIAASGQARRWLGLKIHARNVALAADLEMHLTRGGYVGLSRLDGGAVNICGLFRHAAGEAPADWSEALRGAENSLLRERLAGAAFDEDSFCSVAGLSLSPQRAAATAECRIGDAMTMIPPVTGNGMSMAFESAELAVEPLADYSARGLDWTAARQKVAALCDRRFRQRLAWARPLQQLLLAPWLQDGLVSVALRSRMLRRLVLARTR